MNMSESQSSCLYHGDKAMFDRVTVEIKKAKWIPRPEVSRLAMAVCSCRKKLPVKTTIPKDRLSIVLDYFRNCLTPESQNVKQWSRVIQSYIHELLAQGVEPEDYSATRLLYILYQALEGKVFEALEREGMLPEEEENGEISADDANVKKSKQRLTSKEYKAMMKKRQRKVLKDKIKFLITVPMFPAHMETLERRTGLTLGKYSINKTWAIQPGYKENGASHTSRTHLTTFYVWAKDEKEAEVVRQKILPSAKDIQDDYDKKMAKKRARIDKSRAARYREYDDYSYYSCDEEDDWEAADPDLGEISFRQKGRRKKRGKAGMVSKKTFRVGGCGKCLKPMDGPQDESIDVPCTHHSGSPVLMYAWSCCDMLAMDPKHPKASPEDHESHGCCSGEHVWNTHKKALGNRKRHSSWSNPFVMARKMGM